VTSPERLFEDLFQSPDTRRDNFLARLFGMFSEDVVRHWSHDERAPYEDLGRPTLRSTIEPGFATLDFALRSRADGGIYVAEQKAELAFEGYRYLRLTSASQIEHHAKGRAFAWLLDLARDPASHPVHVRAKPVEVSGAILVWGAVDAAGHADAMATYGFADVLSLEELLRDLRRWDPPDWRATVDQYRRWANELFDGLT
jgi:hypothetical protein